MATMVVTMIFSSAIVNKGGVNYGRVCNCSKFVYGRRDIFDVAWYE